MKRLLLWLKPETVSHWWCYNYRCLAQGVGVKSDRDSAEHTDRTGHMTGISDNVRISR